jgi:CubicO group peptidase (beta-lactamase class C family)
MSVRKSPWFACLLSCTALLAGGCTGGNVPTKDLGTDIDEVAATLVGQPLFHSTSLAVVYRGKEFIRHRGDMEAGRLSPPTDATLYEIGSLSKTLAGTLIANAVLERNQSGARWFHGRRVLCYHPCVRLLRSPC